MDNSKIIIIPDVHLRMSQAMKITYAHRDATQVIYLGDFFDDFLDTVEMNKEMARWLQIRLTQENYIFLWGNHDLHYAYNNINLACGGWTVEKHRGIREILKKKDWDKFKFYHWINETTLVTHAGLSSYFLPPKGVDIKQWLIKEEKEANRCLKTPEDSHFFFRAGLARKGRSQAVGGLTWLDFNSEFVAIEGLNQIFGHSFVDHPVFIDEENSKNYNLDSNLAYYGIYENNELTIHKTP